MGRFLNADGLVSTGQGLLGNNMFAYCNNNPVCSADSTGELPVWLVTAAVAGVGGAIAGAIIGGASYLISSGISGSDTSAMGFLGAVGVGALNGFIGGAAGTLGKAARITMSITTGVFAGVYTAINAEGSGVQKSVAGVFTGLCAAVSTFVGTSVKIENLSNGLTVFANYGVTLAIATPAEAIAVAGQQIINNLDNAIPAKQSRPIPRNYVAFPI